jgi:hypothetical protein
MGGAVAIDLSQHARIAGLITESTFTNSWDMARHLYPYLPIWPLLPNRFRNDEKISRIKIPLLMIHGEDDPLVPASMAKKLYNATTTPAELILVPGANHITSLPMGGEALQTKIERFIKDATSRV